MFGNWGRCYQGSFIGKKIFNRIWEALPKFTCWKIWSVRNKSIIQDEKSYFLKTTLKVLVLLIETFKEKDLRGNEDCDLDDIEQCWIKSLQVFVGPRNNKSNIEN